MNIEEYKNYLIAVIVRMNQLGTRDLHIDGVYNDRDVTYHPTFSIVFSCNKQKNTYRIFVRGFLNREEKTYTYNENLLSYNDKNLQLKIEMKDLLSGKQTLYDLLEALDQKIAKAIDLKEQLEKIQESK